MNPAPNSTPEEKHKKPYKLPDLLRINADGNLFCSDGRDVSAYLKAWAKSINVTAETPLNLVRQNEFQIVLDDAIMFRHMGC